MKSAQEILAEEKAKEELKARGWAQHKCCHCKGTGIYPNGQQCTWCEGTGHRGWQGPMTR